ncbi:thrombospondin type 3 repeat-containing protein [Epilithonimonas xixisoli]|nr:thrombospondin type 3 repeat-containing protein [Epilithonimonas xixisoli]
MPNMPRLPGGFIYEETIVISPLAPLSFSSIATCNGTTTGVAIGGTAPYTYTLYDASGTTVVQPTQPTGSFSGLTVGATYQMRATDTCGRTFNQSFVVAASVLAPTIGIVVQQSCTAPVSSVQLSDLPDGDWIITDSLGGVTFNGTGSTTTLNNLPAGVHTFTVTSGTCTSSASASVTMSPATISGMDSDNDGVDNACDLDDDNDGILDIDEQTCLSSISIGVNPNPVASESYGETIATYTEVSGSVRPITFGGYNGFEPSYPSKVRIDYSKNFINYAFRVADMDNLEKVRLYVYDKTGALITNLLPYVTYKGSGINATTGTGYSLTIEATSDAGGVSNSFDPANYIDFKIPIEISRIDFEYFDRSAVSGASMTPEYYFLSGCVAKDTDGDGIPDYLDLDSDNDGCLDAIEGGANITASQLTTATGTVIVGTGSTASNQNLGNTVGNTATTMGVPTIVGTGQSVGQSQSFAKNDCLDSDGDGIPDWDDVDDDNDGILDTAECSNTITDLANAYSGGALKNIAPSDFGLALNVKHQNVTKDLSSKFGYPANSGAVIISIKNASVHPTADAWWTKNGEQPSVWNVTGTMSAFVLMAQNTEYYGNDSKTIHIYDSTPVIPITLPGLENQTPVAGQWSIVDTPTQKTLNDLNTDTSYQEYGNWRYANMNFGAKSFGFSTTTAFAEPTYAVMMYLECDADMDGVPNRLDLDSDADGCSDAMEGGASITESQLVTAGGTVNGGSTAVNQNLCASSTCVSTSGSNIGLPQLSPLSSGYSNNTGQTVGDSQNALVNSCPSPCAITATNPDSDGDGISDACDLDSDNDGILDTNEGRCSIPTKTTTWTTSAGGSASVTVTSTATVPGIKFTSAPQVLGAANNTSAISFANHTFNPTNFWYTPGIAGSPSLQFDQFWDINQEDADTAASYDAGKRTITIVFPSPINKLLFNIDRLGGNGTINPGVSTRYTNSTEFTMISLNFMMTKLAGNPQFIVTADKFYREPYVDIGIVSPGGEATPASGLPASYGTAAGTVEIKKTDGSSFTTVVFSTTGIGAEGLGDDAMEVILEGCTDRDTDLDGTPDYLDLDSDNDGCSDALEGGASITEYQLVTAGGTVTGGTSTVNQNLCASSACVSASGSNIGLPQILPLPTGYSNTTGQTVGNSINALVNDCLCYESPEDVSAIVPVNHGISALGRAGAENGNWPMLRNSAYTALEAKTKGFVVTRTTSPETTIAIPVVGMMVFDTDEDAGKGCLKIYTGSGVGEGWKCFTTQGCPPPPGK